MAAETPNDIPDEESGLDPGFATSKPSRGEGGWQTLWQAPALIFGGALLVMGLMTIRTASPGNDFDGALEDVQTLLTRQEFDRALTMLNEQIYPALGAEDARPAHRREFHLLRADTIFSAQEAQLANSIENFQSVVADYSQAEELLAELDPIRLSRMATSLLELDRETEALRRAEQIPDSHRGARVAILRRLIDRNLASSDLDEAWARSLLSALEKDPALSTEERVWLVSRTARLELALGDADAALTYLLRSMQRIDALHGPLAGDLYMLLARSYFELGRFNESLRNAERAESHLSPTGSARGDAMVLSAQILQVTGDLEDARDRFAIALARFPALRAQLEGQLGLAEIEFSLGRLDQSLDAYDGLVQMLDDPPRRAREPVTRSVVAQSLLDRRQERIAVEDFEGGLRIARLAQRVYQGAEPPAQITLALADSHRTVAEELIETLDGEMTPRDILRLDPAARSLVRAHLLDAGRSYLQHARRVILTDDGGFGDSLWLAGDSFDLGGDRDAAIEVFTEFARGRPADPRKPAAIYRLAQSHQSLGDYDAASALYEELIADHPRSSEAVASHVLLAETYLRDSDVSNNGDAERLLLAIVQGESLSPEAIEFRDALVELGTLYLSRGNFDEAARRLREASERYPEDPETVHVRFRLAESLRLGATEIAEQLRDAMPSGRRAELERARRSRLQTAMRLYDEVRQSLESAPERTILDDITLRNSYYYRADCSFDLAEFDRAIEHYDAAAQRYAEDPASLVAMMQIVNCYMAMDRLTEARTANERARRRLRELPDDILNAPDLPLDRRHWERWLESSEALTRRANVDDRD